MTLDEEIAEEAKEFDKLIEQSRHKKDASCQRKCRWVNCQLYSN